MMKKEVLSAWKKRAGAAQSKVKEELEPDLKKLCYEQEIAQRLLAKTQDETAQQTWQTQIDVLQTMIVLAENEIAEEREDLILCQAMIAEIEADLGLG